MTRFAVLDDIDELTQWGVKFHNACPYRDADGNRIKEYIHWHITSTTACVIRTSGGMIGAVFQPALAYTDGFVARESFLWCDAPGDGLALIKALQDWAKMRGATHIEMSTLCNVTGQRLGKVLQRRGYEPLQKTYRLELA